MTRICLIGGGTLSTTPRLRKEADALHDAGFSVHAVVSARHPDFDRLDSAIVSARNWVTHKVGNQSGAKRISARVVQEVVRRFFLNNSPNWRRAAYAHSPQFYKLAGKAARTQADFYIGHNLSGLAAAALAAASTNKRFGFDAEDFHSEETEKTRMPPGEERARKIIEQALIPEVQYITAASPPIAEAYMGLAPINPVTVLNVFPFSEAPENPSDLAPISGKRPVRFYWFSQTIGPGRGLEEFCLILEKLKHSFELHLRGHPRTGFVQSLQSRLEDRIIVHPVESPEKMVRLAAGFDLGLSLEIPEPLNHDLCLGNKIFTYLLSGTPVLLSATRAQKALANDLGDACLLIDINDPVDSAAKIDAWCRSPERQLRARQTAWRLGQTRYNWDTEKQKFLETVERAVAGIR